MQDLIPLSKRSMMRWVYQIEKNTEHSFIHNLQRHSKKSLFMHTQQKKGDLYLYKQDIFLLLIIFTKSYYFHIAILTIHMHFKLIHHDIHVQY